MDYHSAIVYPDQTIEVSFTEPVRDEAGNVIGHQRVRCHSYSVEFKADFIADVTGGGGDPAPLMAEAGW